MFNKTLIAGLALALSPLTFAEPMAEASQALCEKVKACSMAEIDKADMTPEMRQMMEPMLENMCANMRAGVEEVPEDHALYKPALACMQGMAALSCEEIRTMENSEPPACEEYRRKAEATYGQ